MPASTRSIPEWTSTTLALQNLMFADAGVYTVVVSNGYGSLESSPANLTVVPIRILYQPSDVSVYVGEPASLYVAAEKNGPFYYQWLKDGNVLTGETNGSLSLPSAILEQAGAYAGSREEATTRTAILALLQPIEAESLPALGEALLAVERGDTASGVSALSPKCTLMRSMSTASISLAIWPSDDACPPPISGTPQRTVSDPSIWKPIHAAAAVPQDRPQRERPRRALEVRRVVAPDQRAIFSVGAISDSPHLSLLFG